MNSPQVLVVLGGSLVYKNGRWQTLSEGDLAYDGLPLNDRWRVLATKQLCLRYPSVQWVVASGGRGVLVDRLPPELSIAKVVGAELAELGVKQAVILEEESENSYQQLKAIAGLMVERRWERVIFVSNHYHLPRLRAMIERGPELEVFHRYPPVLLAAEKVLLTAAPHIWRTVLARVGADPAMVQRIARETEGVRQIYAGEYRFV